MNKLEKAAQDLLDVLAIAMPEVSRIIVMHTNRGGSYSGPNIRPQMDALEAALGAARPHIADEQLRKAAQEVADWGSHVEYINSSIKRRIDTLRSVLARQAQDGLVIGDEQRPLNATDQSAREAGCNCDRKIPYLDFTHDKTCPLYSWTKGSPESTQENVYISTACYHGLHDRCRQSCKFCSTPCQCSCGHKAGNVEAQLKGRE